MAKQSQVDRALEGIDQGGAAGDRIMIVMCLDCSGSMEGDPVRELNTALQSLEADVKKDPNVAARVEIMVIGFGGDVHIYDGWTGGRAELHTADPLQAFVPAKDWKAPVLQADGGTPMGQAVQASLDLVERRKQIIKSRGVTYWRPWIWLMTDGEPTEDEAFWKGVAQHAQRMEQGKHVVILPVGVASATMENLALFSGKRQPVRMKDHAWAAWMEAISASMKQMSGKQTDTGHAVETDGWGDI